MWDRATYGSTVHGWNTIHFLSIPVLAGVMDEAGLGADLGADQPARAGEEVEAAAVGLVIGWASIEARVVLVHAHRVCNLFPGIFYLRRLIRNLAKRTWLDMLCLAEGGDENLLAVAGHSKVSAVGGRREPNVILGPEVGVIAVVEVFHAVDVIRLQKSDEDFTRTYTIKQKIALSARFYLS